MSDRFGKAKYATIRRDFNNLRECIRRWDSEAAEDAWEKCERWLEALPLRAEGGKDMTDRKQALQDLLREAADLLSVERDGLAAGISINGVMTDDPDDQHARDAIAEIDGWTARAAALIAQEGE